MKTTFVNARSAPSPLGGYSQGVVVDGATRLLFISGQIPEGPDGPVPPDFEAQAHRAWKNVTAQLEAAGMSIDHLVKVTIFLSSRRYSEANSRIRREHLGDHPSALTVIVTGILHEEWLLEIEAVAAA